MNEKIEFRPVSLTDFQQLEKFFPKWKKKSLLKKIHKSISDENDNRFVAVLNGTIIGHVRTRIFQRKKKKIALLQSLFVLPEFRAKGIGLAIEKHALSQLSPQIELVYGYVLKGNKASIKLHKKLGFKEIPSDKEGKHLFKLNL